MAQRFENPREILGDRLRPGTIYRFLADFGAQLFPDDYFADLYLASPRGRPTIPARVLSTVTLLQSHEGLSDRDALDRLEADLRWQAAAGLDTGAEGFHPTVLVGHRNRLRASDRPRRLFEDTKVVARAAGVLKGRARVLDSTPLYDSVATQDTVTQLRASIRKLLRALDQGSPALASEVRSALTRDDDYASVGKPACDWDDRAAREVLVDALVRDGHAALAALEGATLVGAAADAAALLALVVGQDVAEGDDGVFRIVRGVAKDRVISTVDPEARHGHKSRNRRFDGYKTHASIDPDSELVDEVVVTPANAPDRDAVDDLLAPSAEDDDKPEVVGDSAYAGAETRDKANKAGYKIRAKVPPVRNRGGRFSKDRFVIDLDDNTVVCPAGQRVAIVALRRGGGRASFAPHCSACPLRQRCTAARKGRSVTIHRHEALLQAARAEQATPEWLEAYRADRPLVERKMAHFARRMWGGRKARCRGLSRISTDVDTRGAVLNFARLAVLGVTLIDSEWVAAQG